MGGLSLSAWITMILCFTICFGGALYCLLLSWGRDPYRIFEILGIDRIISIMTEKSEDVGFYKPFEYMDRGPKEKALGGSLVLLILIILWSVGAFDVDEEGVHVGGDVELELDSDSLEPINGHSDENTEQVLDLSIEEAAITNITFTLTWDDEQANTGMENYPDEFQLNVSTPWGAVDQTDMEENDGNGHGEISLVFQAPGEHPDTGSAGNYNVIIRMGEAGDQWPIIVGPSAGFNDNGNDWTLTVDYEYLKEKPEGGGILD